MTGLAVSRPPLRIIVGTLMPSSTSCGIGFLSAHFHMCLMLCVVWPGPSVRSGGWSAHCARGGTWEGEEPTARLECLPKDRPSLNIPF